MNADGPMAELQLSVSVPSQTSRFFLFCFVYESCSTVTRIIKSFAKISIGGGDALGKFSGEGAWLFHSEIIFLSYDPIP